MILMKCRVCKDDAATFLPETITIQSGYPYFSCSTCRTHVYSDTVAAVSAARPDAAWNGQEGTHGRERFESRLKAKIAGNAASRKPLNVAVAV